MMKIICIVLASLLIIEVSSKSKSLKKKSAIDRYSEQAILKKNKGADWTKFFDFYSDTANALFDPASSLHNPNTLEANPNKFKGKHDRNRPANVGSITTHFKNNWILFTSMGVTIGCYSMAWGPLFFGNDAGAFFTDCMTMWTQYVFFFKDPDHIDFSYVWNLCLQKSNLNFEKVKK